MGRAGVSDPGLVRHRKLLFRSYLFLAAGLLVVATVLDFGFGALHDAEQAADDEQWLRATFALVESRLHAVPADERNEQADALAREIGTPITLLQRDEVVSQAAEPAGLAVLTDANGNDYYLMDAPRLDGLLRIGPVPAQSDSIWVRILPPVFYLSIFIVVGLWLRPLLKDVNLMTSAAQRFAADYREPLKTAERTTQMTALAQNLDDMSARLSGLIQSQKELIAALSHEMRTPLARIRFALAVIENEGDEELKEKLEELAGDVQEIDRLIGTMLDYARLDHPDLRMHWQRVPLEPWLAQIATRSRRPDRPIKVTVRAGTDAATMDPRLMELALNNLVSNACRYAKRRVDVSVDAHEGGFRATVADDGTGIPQAERRNVFKVFARLDDSRNRETGGYGLGLAIVARIAALHGGNAAVGDAALGGAEFTITWPVAGQPS